MTRGTSIVDAVVSAGLAGIAVAALVAVASLATGGLRLARDLGIAVAVGHERLETLRAGPRASGDDRVIGRDGTIYVRRWTVVGGRGRPLVLSDDVTWGRRSLALRTETIP